MNNPYHTAMLTIQAHKDPRAKLALAKCILSLYNPEHAFSIGEILTAGDAATSAITVAMLNEFAASGETEVLRQVGEWVHNNFPELIQVSNAMSLSRHIALNRIAALNSAS